MEEATLTIRLSDEPPSIARREGFNLLRRIEAIEESLRQAGITVLENFIPCQTCGQIENGQAGEYPCKTCGIPTVHDEPTS